VTAGGPALGWIVRSAFARSLRVGLAAAALLVGLVVMHSGLASTDGGGRAGSGHAAHLVGGAGDPAGGMIAAVAPSRAGGVAAAAGIGPAISAALPGTAGDGGSPHAGGTVCLTVLAVGLLGLSFSRFVGWWIRRRAGDGSSLAVRGRGAVDRPPRPSAALTRLSVLRM
jgi:hypothetical protein